MPKNVIHGLIGVAVAAGVALFFNLLPSLLGAKVDLGLQPMILSAIAGIATYFILTNISGNRKVSTVDAATHQRALAFEVPPERAALYVMRTGFPGRATGMNISIDGRDVAQIKSYRFTRVDVPPGAHTVVVAFAGPLGAQGEPAELKLEVKAGEAAVLHLRVKMGAFAGSPTIERVELATVRADLQGMRMTAPDVAAL